jgi:uncharacterized protein (DUF1697 family)
MNRYIAFLRAINVGGYRKIKMENLRNMFEEMGFENVQTYIQSGNVVFDSDKSDTMILSKSIEKKIESEFGHDVPVMIRTSKVLEKLINENPFDGKNEDPFRLYVTFFLEPPSPQKQKELIDLSSNIEKFDFVDGDLFSLIDKKTDQKVNFSNGYVEKIIGIPGTGRNWRTVNKMVEMSRRPAR